MKKIIIASLVLMLANSVCFSQKMYSFDGISFDKRGHKVQKPVRNTTGKNAGSSSISGHTPWHSYNFYISKSKSDGTPLNVYAEKFQATILDNMLNNPTSKLKLKSKTEIEDMEINGMKAKHFNVKYRRGKKFLENIYFLEKDGYLITIITTSNHGNNKKHNNHFSKLLETFSFMPE